MNPGIHPFSPYRRLGRIFRTLCPGGPIEFYVESILLGSQITLQKFFRQNYLA